MNREEFCRQHWEYFLALESDFLNTERYVSFDLGDDFLYDTVTHTNFENSKVYSIEYIKQYQAICSEVDVIMKSICNELGQKANNIHEYAQQILNKWPNIINQKVKMKNIELQPFKNWKYFPNQQTTLDWWKTYNNVKHERLLNYKKANLKNVLNALAGLYVLELYLVKFIGDRDSDMDVPNDVSKLFVLDNFTTRETVIKRNCYIGTDNDIDKMF